MDCKFNLWNCHNFLEKNLDYNIKWINIYIYQICGLHLRFESFTVFLFSLETQRTIIGNTS